MIDTNKKVRKINVNGTEMAFANYSQPYQEMLARTLDKTITELSDPNRVINVLSSSMFTLCYNLSKVDLPVCTIIGSGAFTGCNKLVLLNLTNCSFIGSSAFHTCYSLNTVNIPVCSRLNEFAFATCSSLPYINMPDCKYIGRSAFYNCKGLSQVILNVSNCELAGSTAFYNSPISDSSYLGYFGSIYVPSEYVSAYKASTNWMTYSNRITSIENLPSDV